MANGWNADSDREAMLRRVAIVLSSLPAPMANQLLGSMGQPSQQAVRRTMTTLSDVDPLERQRALQAFRVSIQQQPVTESVTAAAIDTPTPAATSRVMSSAGVEVVRAPIESSASGNPIAPDSPLAFLGDIDDDTLLAVLQVEHPQTIAMVLASIAPAQAARVLPRLPHGPRNETLSRLGRLGEVPDAAAAEVAEHFRDRLNKLRRGGGNQFKGQRALDAILAAMPERAAISGEMETQHRGPSNPDGNDAAWTSSDAVMRGANSESLDFPTADRHALDLSQKLRQAVGESTDPQSPKTTAEPSQPSLRVFHAESAATARAENVDRAIADSMDANRADANHATMADRSILHSTDSIHEYLISLSPTELCMALGKVETRDAMLTLCGLPNEVTEAALAILPRAHAKKVRASMNALGSLQLREIDEAKERVAGASLPAPELSVPSMPMAA